MAESLRAQYPRQARRAVGVERRARPRLRADRLGRSMRSRSRSASAMRRTARCGASPPAAIAALPSGSRHGTPVRRCALRAPGPAASGWRTRLRARSPGGRRAPGPRRAARDDSETAGCRGCTFLRRRRSSRVDSSCEAQIPESAVAAEAPASANTVARCVGPSGELRGRTPSRSSPPRTARRCRNAHRW